MKRIFLTSGLVLCMACPAFALENANGVDIASGSTGESCVYNTLEGYNGTSTFTAQWTTNWSTINLNVNSANGGSTNGAPTPLYAANGVSSVYTGRDGNSDANYVLTGKKDDGDVVLTTPATGITVNYQVDNNVPGGRSVVANTGTSSGGARAFAGYYADQVVSQANRTAETGALIDSSSELTALGASTASGYAVGGTNTWYAQYKCVTPTVTNPQVSGYTFAGWYDGAGDNANQVQLGCIDADTSIVAHWTANVNTITYSCGSLPSGSAGTLGNTAPADQTDILTDGAFTLAELAAGECTAQGYHFVGWDCGNSITYDANQTETTSGNGYAIAGATGTYTYVGTTTCTAQWAPNNITTTWVGNGGTVSGGESSCTYDDGITIPTVTRPGYILSGWEVVNTPAN